MSPDQHPVQWIKYSREQFCPRTGTYFGKYYYYILATLNDLDWSPKKYRYMKSIVIIIIIYLYFIFIYNNNNLFFFLSSKLVFNHDNSSTKYFPKELFQEIWWMKVGEWDGGKVNLRNNLHMLEVLAQYWVWRDVESAHLLVCWSSFSLDFSYMRCIPSSNYGTEYFAEWKSEQIFEDLLGMVTHRYLLLYLKVYCKLQCCIPQTYG